MGTYTDVMIDLETLGTSSRAPIIQIGATAFNRETQEIGQTFTMNCVPDLSKYQADFKTIEWWMHEDQDAARRKVFGNGVDLKHALRELMSWWFLELDEDVQVWAMPPSFDVVILENALTAEGIDVPWKYDKTRCLRTVSELAGIRREDRAVPAVPHDAGEDAKAQALTLFKGFDRLGFGAANPEDNQIDITALEDGWTEQDLYVGKGKCVGVLVEDYKTGRDQLGKVVQDMATYPSQARMKLRDGSTVILIPTNQFPPPLMIGYRLDKIVSLLGPDADPIDPEIIRRLITRCSPELIHRLEPGLGKKRTIPPVWS